MKKNWYFVEVTIVLLTLGLMGVAAFKSLTSVSSRTHMYVENQARHWAASKGYQDSTTTCSTMVSDVENFIECIIEPQGSASISLLCPVDVFSNQKCKASSF